MSFHSSEGNGDYDLLMSTPMASGGVRSQSQGRAFESGFPPRSLATSPRSPGPGYSEPHAVFLF